MKITLAGTEHTKNDEEIEVTIEKALVDGDDWTFTIGGRIFTIGDLTDIMDFLKRAMRRQG